MSLNAKKNRGRRARLIKSADLADYGISGHGSMATVAEIVRSEERAISKKYVSAEGLAQLAEKGVAAFQAATADLPNEWAGRGLPHNLIRSEGSGSVGVVGPYGRTLPIVEASAEIELYARFGGWLTAAAELPNVRRLILRTNSVRGLNSPYTTWPAWEIFHAWPSPHALERKLKRVITRARVIMEAYDTRLRPSWDGVAYGLRACPGSVGKAAVIAVARTLGWGRQWWETSTAPHYREARQWLEDTRTARFSTTVVKCRNRRGLVFPLAGSAISSHGWQIETALHVDQFGRRELVDLATCGEVVFVCQQGCWQTDLNTLLREFVEGDTGKLSVSFRSAVLRVRARAECLLSGWRNQPEVDRWSAAEALLSTWDTERAAYTTALSALGKGTSGALEELQQRLFDLSDAGNPIADNSDGVECYLHPAPLLEQDGATVTLGVTVAEDGTRAPIWVARFGERTYHARWAHFGAEGVLEYAQRAWARQDAALGVSGEVLGFLRGETGVCPLVVRRDSNRAGNCSPGTEAWLRSRGWADRKWIPAVWLIPHLGDERVRQVAATLKRTFASA